MDRGVIAAPGIITPIDQGFVMERSISEEELRYYVMYWNRVVIPGNNLVYIGVPEEEGLIKAGAISRPRVSFQGSFQGDQITYAILSCQSIVAAGLVTDKSMDWVIHQIGDQTAFPSQYGQERNVLRVTLANALPVPSLETPINEILEFKEKRKDELNELHETLDELYEEVLRSPDPELATKRAVSRLKDSILNIDAASTERFAKSRKYDFSAQLNLNGKDIVVSASAGALIDFFSSGFSIPLATVAGAVASLIKINAKAAYTFKPAEANSKLAYLSHATKEGMIE
jgi:hypothetical protein